MVADGQTASTTHRSAPPSTWHESAQKNALHFGREDVWPTTLSQIGMYSDIVVDYTS